MSSKGLVIVNTGEGKGKTTAALGMVLRAVGHGMRVLVIQFVKSGTGTGEIRALEGLTSVSVEVSGLGFMNDPDVTREQHEEAARAALENSRKRLVSGEFEVVVLDEILLAVKEGLLKEDDVTGLMAVRPENVHLVLTGRGCPDSVVRAADIVTEMGEVKHAYSEGVDAQQGVEF